MMIFIKKSLVFFATPKTGSTAFHRALSPKADMVFDNVPKIKHISPKMYNRRFASYVEPMMPTSAMSLAVIREPIDWLGSWYRYRARPEIAGSENSTAKISFDQFVEAYLSDTQPSFAKIGAQSQFVTGGGDQPLVTHLWRYDAIADLRLFLSLHLEHDFKLNKANVSPKQKIDLSPENKRALMDVFAKDFDLFENAIGAD